MSESARILIVEDESIVAKDIQSGLQGMGYTVVGMVATGEEALERAATLRPDLVLMDIKLKGDLDGIETAHRLRTTYPVPVVYLTALQTIIRCTAPKRPKPSLPPEAV